MSVSLAGASGLWNSASRHDFSMMVDPLIHRFLEDPSGLEEQELDQLVALLRAEPQRAIELREQLLVSDCLSQKLAIDRQNFFAQIEQRIADFQRGEEEMYDHVAELRAIAEAEIDKPLRPAPRSEWLKYSLAAALSLLLVAAVALWQWSGPGSRPVALVEELSGEVTIVRGSERITPQLGKAISTGDQVVSTAGSTIEWKYKDGTTVRIVGDAVSFVRADGRTGAKQVQLDQGELVATVSKQERGPMIFSTPHATATVRGTELRLVVGQADTHLDVTEGEVDLTRLTDGETIQVAANETAIATGDRITLKLPQWPLDRSRAVFLFEGADKATLCRNPQTGNFRDTPLEAQGKASVSTRQTLVLEGGSFASADAAKDLHALIEKTGKYTIEIALTPQTLAKESGGTVLCFGDQPDAGITLRQEGANLLFMQMDAAGIQALPLPLLTAGQRVHLLVTFDGETLAAYVNGIAAGERLEQATLREWPAGPLTVGARWGKFDPWQGEIVRLAIFAHAMDADEARGEFARFELVIP